MAAPASRVVSVVPTRFNGKNKDGDFRWMVQQPQYSDTLFIIAENFLDSIIDVCEEGAGTAVLRSLCPQRVSSLFVPRAVGVPTGWSVASLGFGFMDTVYVKTAIDLSLDRISLVLQQHPRFKRIVYSCDADDPMMLGVNIFETTLGDDVRKYISAGIHNIGQRAAVRKSLMAIRKQELKLLPFALKVSESNNKPSRKRGRDDGESIAPRKLGAKQQTLVTMKKTTFGVV